MIGTTNSQGFAAPRAGQKVWQYFQTNIAPKAANFTQHRNTHLPCGPGRAEIHTGLFGGVATQDFGNHGVSDDENAPVTNYLSVYETGNLSTIRGWQGPWNYDLAYQLPATHVPQSQQVGLRSAADDLQAFSGSLVNWLGRAGIPVGVFGKWQNGYRTGNPTNVLPGVVTQSIVDSSTAHFTSNRHEFGTAALGGPNTSVPWNTQYPSPNTTNTTYGYKITPTLATYNSGTNTATVTAAKHNLETGDYVTLTSMPDAGYNGQYMVTAATSTTFSYNPTTPPTNTNITTGFSTAGSKVWATFETWLDGKRIRDFINAQTPLAPFFVYWAPRACHIDSDGTYNNAMDVRYKGTVSQTQAFTFNGVPGATSPVGPTTSLASYKTAWEGRQEQLCQVDDVLALICPLLQANWPNNWTIIFTSDNGDQIGEQDGRNSGTIKTSIFDGSLRAPLYIYGPRFEAKTIADLPTCHADLPLTILDLFGQTDHHAHTNRDGYSILRSVDPTDTVRHARALPCYGAIATNGEDGYVDWDATRGTSRKRIRGTKQWDLLPTIDFVDPVFGTATQYENQQIVRVTGSADDNAFQARANAIQASRWNPTTDQNNAHTAPII